MAVALSQKVADRVPEAANLYYRLILIVGPPRTGKTKALRDLAQGRDWPLVNVNLELSERLLDLTSKQRALRVPRLLGEIADGHPGEVLLLDNTEILFSTELQQDPLRLIQGLSRNRTVVATWCGEMDGEDLVYATPGHPEYRKVHRPQVLVVATAGDPNPTEQVHLDHQTASKEKIA
ncbi:MAG: BREX-3 system P-loop-containing protein BrxF [Bradymonadales bacterium]|nr:BREX-3 system P-loop-containing protein BrxF [Bradymonadales bacterium]